MAWHQLPPVSTVAFRLRAAVPLELPWRHRLFGLGRCQETTSIGSALRFVPLVTAIDGRPTHREWLAACKSVSMQ